MRGPEDVAEAARAGPRVLYIVYWGALEPLGQSLVVPAVVELARRGVSLTLMTHEKPADLAPPASAQELRRTLDAAGVRWTPLRYHKRPRVPATSFDVLHAWLRGSLLGWRERPHIVHARTFVGGLMGLGVSRLAHCRLVFHNEGFYADEQVDAGVWREGSRVHRLAKRLESTLYARADGVVTLSRAASAVVRELRGEGGRAKPIAVVPSAVDLEHFKARARERVSLQEGPRFVYAGSVGGRYLLGDVGRFAAVARVRYPRTHLTVLSWADAGLVASTLRSAGLPDEAFELRLVPRHDMPLELPRHHAGLHFVRTAASGAGGSPTKVGEYWACGLPVLVSSGLGDLDEIIGSEGVGVSLRECSREAFEEALSRLEILWRDPGSGPRCRRAAERHYNLHAACETQVGLYDSVCRMPRLRS